MSKDHTFFSSLAKLGGAVGKGLISGFAGTLAITAAQMIEMQISKREGSAAPMIVAGKTLGVEPRGKAEAAKEKERSAQDQAPDHVEKKVQSNTEKFSQITHFSYGTAWGMARGAMDLVKLRGWPATAIHFAALWSTALVMLPAAGASKPATKWPPQQILMDALFHAVYALAAGATYDAMKEAEKKDKKQKLFRKLRKRWTLKA